MVSSYDPEPRVEYVVIPPDGGWGWFVVLVAFIWNMFVDGTSYSFALFMTEMIADFKVSQSLMVAASSVQMGVYFLLGPIVAAMINRFGFRTVAGVGGLLGFAGLLSSAYIHNIYLFIGIFGCVLGFSFSMVYMCNILVVTFYFSKYRAVATCIAAAGNSMGVSLFPLINTYLLPDEMSWRDKYKYVSGGHLLMAVCAMVYKPIEPCEVVVEGGKNYASNTSIWEDYPNRDRTARGLLDYPTNAEALINTDYTIFTPNEYVETLDSRISFRSTNTTHRSRNFSIANTLFTSVAELQKYTVTKVCCCRCQCKYRFCTCLWHDTRPMYRDDILYNGVTTRLEQYNLFETDTSKAATHYHMNVTRTSHAADMPDNADCCNCCPDSIRRVLTTMLDCSLIKSCAFFLLCLSGFLTYLGLYSPYMYGIEVSIFYNVEKSKASYILTTIGVANCAGRIGWGMFATLVPKFKPMHISIVTLIVAGCSCIAHPFFANFIVHIVCAAGYGFHISTISSLRTVLVVDLLGLEKLTNAFGLIILMEGLSSLIALPLNAFLREIYGGFIVPFVFSGSMIVLSGIILILVTPLYRLEVRRRNTVDTTYKPTIKPGSSKKH